MRAHLRIHSRRSAQDRHGMGSWLLGWAGGSHTALRRLPSVSACGYALNLARPASATGRTALVGPLERFGRWIPATAAHRSAGFPLKFVGAGHLASAPLWVRASGSCARWGAWYAFCLSGASAWKSRSLRHSRTGRCDPVPCGRRWSSASPRRCNCRTSSRPGRGRHPPSAGRARRSVHIQG